MRVLHVVTTLSGGGAERFVASLAPALGRQGIRTAVMPVYACAIPWAVQSATNVDVLPVKRRGRFDAAFLTRMISSMRSWRPDVVHTHMHNGTYWGRAAAIAAGVSKIVRTEHLPCDPQARAQGTGIADRILNAATTTIVTFFEEQGRFLADYEKFDPRKIHPIPNGIAHGPIPTAIDIQEARRRLGVPAGAFAMIVLANLHRHKNQRLAVEALAHLSAPARSRARLYLLGDGDDRAALQSLARERHVDDIVTFLGFRNDVQQLLPGANLMVMPSLTEGMPLALIEGMSLGVPILSTPWMGARDMLLDGRIARISPDWDPVNFAREIERAMSDAAATRAVARDAQQFARSEYDIDVTAARHAGLYQSLLMEHVAA